MPNNIHHIHRKRRILLFSVSDVFFFYSTSKTKHKTTICDAISNKADFVHGIFEPLFAHRHSFMIYIEFYNSVMILNLDFCFIFPNRLKQQTHYQCSVTDFNRFSRFYAKNVLDSMCCATCNSIYGIFVQKAVRARTISIWNVDLISFSQLKRRSIMKYV